LQSAKERYEVTEPYVREARYVDLTIVLREEGAGGGDGDAEDAGTDLVAETEAPPTDPDAPPAKPFDVAAASEKGTTIGPIRIAEDDTLSSVESKLVVLLREANKSDVRIRLYPYFVAARGGTAFPQDAMLVNLNLPKRLNIVI
jgi:hypothetical protein